LVTQAFSVKRKSATWNGEQGARGCAGGAGILAPGFAGDNFGGIAGAADFTLYTMLGFLRRSELKLPEIAFGISPAAIRPRGWNAWTIWSSR